MFSDKLQGEILEAPIRIWGQVHEFIIRRDRDLLTKDVVALICLESVECKINSTETGKQILNSTLKPSRAQ
jgi:hypothetical protein